MSGRWAIALHSAKPSPDDLSGTMVIRTVPGSGWERDEDGYTVNRYTLGFAPPTTLPAWGIQVTHASVFDLERGVCIEVITLSGNGGRIYNNTSPSIPAGGIRFKQGGSVAVEASPESTPAWHQFRHTAPGDCPCGIVKSMCEYHR